VFDLESAAREAMRKPFNYRDYLIRCDPPPIPDRRYDWEWRHVDYDGDPESSDDRAGRCASLAEAVLAIDSQMAEAEA
jgi:hypothetical protein